MPANRSITSTVNGYLPGTLCLHTFFNNPFNLNTSISGSVPASCGFNQDHFAYCPISNGDQQIQDYIHALQALVSLNVSCHPSKDIVMPYSQCADMLAKAPDGFNVTQIQAMMQIKYGINPKIINNAPCVQ